MLIRHQPAKPLEWEVFYFARWLVCGATDAARLESTPSEFLACSDRTRLFRF